MALSAILPGQIQTESRSSKASYGSSSTLDPQAGHSLHEVLDLATVRNTEDEDEAQTPAFRRRDRRHLRELRLKDFLKANGFRDVSDPRQGGCFSFKERLWPLHVAARLGDHEMVQILLAAGADTSQKTSKGRTALEIAEGSGNWTTVDVLRFNTKVMTASQFSKYFILSKNSLCCPECPPPKAASGSGLSKSVAWN